MRVAILHDYLNQLGGAERVLQALLEMFPEADLYTLFYEEKKTQELFKGRITKTSFLDNPLVRRKHRFFIPLMPFAARNLKGQTFYDLVISSTAGYGKGINVEGTYHISYCHSPLRYAWEIDYLKNLPLVPRPLKEVFLKPICVWLKQWDQKTSLRVNLFITNSNFTAKKIMSYYAREARVIYPPVDTSVFYPQPLSRHKNYYLMVGRLLYYKGFDLGIRAFNDLRRPLKIVGAGPEAQKLKKLVRSPHIEFIFSPSDDELRILYSNARALIFPQIEDFGLVAAEAQACGLPVIALNQGGSLEIVRGGQTGIFFKEQTPEAIVQAVLEFENLKFDRNLIIKNAASFSKINFKNRFLETVRAAGFAI